MGIAELIRGKRVYFDTMIFIYLIEGSDEFKNQLTEITNILLDGDTEIVTSELTLCETLVVPFRNNDIKMIDKYRQFIEKSGAFELCPTTLDTYIRASLYRAQFGLKTSDSIHVATAVEAGCDVFITNDKPLKAPFTMQVVKMRDLQ
jgi:predicted nucleic acid-binding protein